MYWPISDSYYLLILVSVSKMVYRKQQFITIFPLDYVLCAKFTFYPGGGARAKLMKFLW